MRVDPLPKCVLLGGGGHARVVLDSVVLMGTVEIAGIIDRGEGIDRTVLELPVLGDDSSLSHLDPDITHFVMGIGSTGASDGRSNAFKRAIDAGLTPVTVTHPSSVCSRSSSIGSGSFVGPGAILNAGASLGENVIVNTAAVVEHDCSIGAHAHIAPHATLSGGVHVGIGAHVGAGAVVLQGLRVEEGAIVGAGAVVTADVSAGSLVKGIPAREG